MSDTTEALFEDKSADRIGLSTIDRYQIMEQIGVGAMGIVYRVHDPVFDCDRALKILRTELIDEEDTKTRFQDEGRAAVRAAGEISHPNIITVYDVGEFEGRPYIVMELFRGVALDAMLAEGRKFSLLETLQIADQLSSALASAHSHDVVHRDIKPGNVLLSEEGLIAKLTDFSVAQVRIGDENDSLTRTGVVIGAPRYMPPEQALGREVDGRSDLYGLGIMLYEILTGQKAYKSETFTALLIEISQSQLASVRSLNKSVPPGVSRIVAKLVEKDPARRFQTAGELRNAVRREIRDMTLRESRKQSGLPTELITAALLGTLVAGALGVTGYLLRKQQIEALEQQTAAIGEEFAGVFSDQLSSQFALTGADAVGDLYRARFQRSGLTDNFAYQTIVSDRGRVLASTQEGLDGTVYEAPAEIEVLSDTEDGTRTTMVQTPAGETVLQVSRDIETGPARARTKVGEVHIGFPTDRIEAIGATVLRLMLLVGLLVASFVALLSFVLVRFFSQPMKRLRDSLNVMATGDYDVRLPDDKSGIIGGVYNAFNAAARMLSQRPVGATPEWLQPSDPAAASPDSLSELDLERQLLQADDMPDEAEAEPSELPYEVPETISAELSDLPVDEKTIVMALQDDDYGDITDLSDVPVDDATRIIRLED